MTQQDEKRRDNQPREAAAIADTRKTDELPSRFEHRLRKILGRDSKPKPKLES